MWDTPENWSSGSVPGVNDTAVFPDAINGVNDYVVITSGDIEVQTISFSGNCKALVGRLGDTITAHSGIKGGANACLLSKVVYMADVETTNKSDYGKKLIYGGGLESDYVVTITGNQNNGVLFTNGVIRVK